MNKTNNEINKVDNKINTIVNRINSFDSLAQIFQDMTLEEQDDFYKDFELIKKKINEPIVIKMDKEKSQKPLFKCRICGYPKYEGVYGDSIMILFGGKLCPLAYQCSNCSVIFKDPEKFTKSD